MSTFSGALTGDFIPLKYSTGLTQAYKSIFCLKVTLIERKLSPTGVISGPFIAIKFSLI